ncbi:hypothetical protein F2Q70_00033654 [Brassica cretica]|uniref:Replication factor A C-terminal domain-containing protein n=1 Tax=Brassica cretica TaxID=69181 RepID=A0A8S9FKZ5_BRACR|nr:hypothetical protein F2Q70_00033654 [Brassica cretica]
MEIHMLFSMILRLASVLPWWSLIAEIRGGWVEMSSVAGLEKHWEQPRSFIAGGYAKVEPLSISELNEFVITAEPQEIEFVCTGMVSEIKMDKGWCYVSCSRYRVEMSIADDTDEGLFVAFDGVRSII